MKAMKSPSRRQTSLVILPRAVSTSRQTA